MACNNGVPARRSVCLVSPGLLKDNLRLQPWRYLSEVACRLSEQGHRVTVFSDGLRRSRSEKSFSGAALVRLPSVGNSRWRPNRLLQDAIKQVNPEVVIWHVGLTSFLHQGLNGWGGRPAIGIFTSPVYTLKDLARLGAARLARGYRLSAVHLLGSLLPRRLLRKQMAYSSLQCLVVQTHTTCRQLVESGLWKRPVQVIPPGVDEHWYPLSAEEVSAARRALGYGPQDTLVVYFGAPAPLRGLPTLLQAFERALQDDATLRLLILSRCSENELSGEEARLRRLLRGSPAHPHIQLVSGYLEPAALARRVAAGDIVALPFDLLPSDAPLSLLEAQALGRPLVTTRLACLPELAAQGIHALAEPGDPGSLSWALLQAARASREPAKLPGRAGSRPPARGWQEVGAEWSRLIQAL